MNHDNNTNIGSIGGVMGGLTGVEQVNIIGSIGGVMGGLTGVEQVNRIYRRSYGGFDRCGAG